jgi:translation initiation factor 1
MVKIIKEKLSNLLWNDEHKDGKSEEIMNTNSEMVPSKHTLKIRLEKNARGGKVVTVIFELPDGFATYFAEQLKVLKNTCGTGGTYKNNRIELQGDHREKVQNKLEQIGFKIKLAGG